MRAHRYTVSPENDGSITLSCLSCGPGWEVIYPGGSEWLDDLMATAGRHETVYHTVNSPGEPTTHDLDRTEPGS